MTRIVIFIAFLTCIYDLSKAQNTDTLKANQLYGQGLKLAGKGDYEAAFRLLDEAKTIFAAAGKESVLLELLGKEVLMAHKMQDFKAMKTYLDELEPLAEKHRTGSIFAINYFNYKGVYFSAVNNYDGALTYYLRYEALLTEYQQQHPLKATAMGGVYNNIATAYGEKLDRKNATIYFEKARDLYEKDANYLKTAQIYLNLAILKWDTPAAKIKDLRKAFAMLNLEKEESTSAKKQMLAAKVNNEMAACFFELGKTDSAEVYLTANLQAGYEDYLEETYLNLAKIYIQQKKYEKAEEYLKKSLSLYVEYYGKYHKSIASCYEYLAQIREQKKEKEAAIAFIRKGIAAVCLDFDPNKNNTLNNTLPDIDMVLEPVQLSNLLIIYQRLTDPAKAYEIAQLSYRLAEQEGKKTNSSDNRMELLKFNYVIYEQAVAAAYQLYEKSSKPQLLQDALQYMETSRSQLLMSALYPTTQTAEQDSILQKGRELEHLKEKLVYEIFEHQNYEESDAATQKVQALKVLENEQIKWKQALKITRPKLYEMRYGNAKAADIAEIQKGLKAEDCLIEYFVGDEVVYAFAITPKETSLKILGKSKKLKEDIAALYELLTTIPTDKDLTTVVNGYSDVAWPFFEKWVKPLLPTNLQKLIIIPDGELAYIPFDALLTEKNDAASFKDLAFLIKKCRVHYRYASSLDMKAQSKNVKNKGNILAFAPSYTDKPKKNQVETGYREALKELPGAKAEVDMLFKKFRGSYYFGNEAGEARFKSLEKSDHYSVVHFAMHGLVDLKQPDNSSLVFTNLDDKEDNILKACEIVGLNLNVNLVVLSACETGYGKYEHGEGVISLGRSFMYAGVPAVVSTLWPLNDQAGISIMSLFYELLSKGYAIDEALREAKLSFLNKMDGMAAHPFLWAGFISIGDENPIELAKKSLIEKYWLYGMLIVFTVLGILIFVWRINQLSLGRQSVK